MTIAQIVYGSQIRSNVMNMRHVEVVQIVQMDAVYAANKDLKTKKNVHILRRKTMTKQEQIEEMAKNYCKNEFFCSKGCQTDGCRTYETCETIYNAGYRKIDDKCAVITKDDLNLYKKQAVKDTAKEICDLILEHWEKKQLVECDWLRVKIAEKYGVEAEE